DGIVDAGGRLEAHDLAVRALRLDVERRLRRERGQPADRERLLAGQAEGRRTLPGRELQRQDAHPDQVRAMDALEGLGDDRADAEEDRTLRGPVARASGAVLLAREHDEGRALAAVAHGRVVDRHLLARGDVPGPPAFALHELVPKADVREGPADQHLVIPAARAVLV